MCGMGAMKAAIHRGASWTRIGETQGSRPGQRTGDVCMPGRNFVARPLDELGESVCAKGTDGGGGHRALCRISIQAIGFVVNHKPLRERPALVVRFGVAGGENNDAGHHGQAGEGDPEFAVLSHGGIVT